MSVTVSNTTDQCAALVESTLVDYFGHMMHDAAAISPAYLALWKDMYGLVQAGGKRLRPRMAYLSYRAFGGGDLAAFAPVATATELLHQSMLVHDDIIDRDLIRYGAPNMTARYLDRYAPYISDAAERLHYAESAALLAGDLLLSGAHRLVSKSHLTAATKTAVQAILTRSLFEVAGGELLDTEAAFIDPADVKPLTIARYKTAGYSFISPLLIGATAAGASDADKQALRQFAEQLGIAFQLQDDILGVFGDSQITGKSTLSDLREGKYTYLVESFDILANEADKTAFHTYFGQSELGETEADILRALLVSSGARSQVELKITYLESQIVTALAAMTISPDHHQEFVELMHKSLKRNF